MPSVVPLWEGANWLEREVWDMFGIRFEGHPDLRRILMPEEFTAFPLRKDYPLQGRGERHNFPVLHASGKLSQADCRPRCRESDMPVAAMQTLERLRRGRGAATTCGR